MPAEPAKVMVPAPLASSKKAKAEGPRAPGVTQPRPVTRRGTAPKRAGKAVVPQFELAGFGPWPLGAVLA